MNNIFLDAFANAERSYVETPFREPVPERNLVLKILGRGHAVIAYLSSVCSQAGDQVRIKRKFGDYSSP